MNILRRLAVVIVVILSPIAANADIIDLGDSTLDDSTGLEWLDLTLTTGRSYNAVVGGFGGYAVAGYVHATLSQICEFWSNAGAGTDRCLSETDSVTEGISQESADLLVGLLGATHYEIGSYNSNIGIFDSGLTGSGLLGLACVNAGSLTACFRSIPNPPTVERQLDSRFLESTGSSIGHYLVRAVSVPEPTTLALFGIGLFGMGLARRKKV